MRYAFVALLLLHGLIHLLGPTKAFGWANVSQLRAPITPVAGLAWLVAAILLVSAAVALLQRAPWWWWPAVPGIVLSQVMIVSVWSDAKVGTLANLALLLPLVVSAADTLPSSFRSRYSRDRRDLLAAPSRPGRVVTEADLAPLPRLLQQYLRRVGVVGRPRVRNLQVTFGARMRSSATSAWMPATVQQFESFDPPARLFLMDARRSGVPIRVYHRYVGAAATFQVRLAGLLAMVDKAGPTLTHDETVTLMNDVLVLAPAAVLDLPFTFDVIDTHTLAALFTNAGFRVTAIVKFDDAGDLIGFTSTDRAHGREDGAATWSTPISGYREVDGIRIGTIGATNWIEPAGEWTYGEFEVTAIAYNVTR